MTTAEAAAILRVDRSRVLQLIRQGRLKATKRGRDWWIEESDIEAVRVRKIGRPAKR